MPTYCPRHSNNNLKLTCRAFWQESWMPISQLREGIRGIHLCSYSSNNPHKRYYIYKRIHKIGRLPVWFPTTGIHVMASKST
jgi:hypothetical protein